MIPEEGPGGAKPEEEQRNETVEVFKNSSEQKICQKHGIPLFEISRSYMKSIYDKEGLEVDSKEEEITELVCPECERGEDEKREMDEIDRLIDQFYLNPTNSDAGEEIDKRLSDPAKQGMKTSPYSIIDIYAPMLSELAGCQLEVGEALVKFLISAQLHHLKMEDSMDLMLPNLAYLWIAPSAVGKDPAINNGIRDFLDVLVGENRYRLYNEVTGPEFVRSVGQIFAKNQNQSERIRTLNVWNEFSTFAKLSVSKGTNTGIETLNQAIDGYIQGRATVNRKEDFGSNVYTMVFAAGTPTFLKYIGDDFFDLGGASRFDFLPYRPPELMDLQPTRDVDGGFKKDLKVELNNIRNRAKEVRWEPEMWDAYNVYRKKILTEVRNCQMTMQDSLAEENYGIISKGKFPLKVLKHAVIHAIARHNYTESGVVFVGIEDLNRAIQDIEKHHGHLMDLFSAYKEMDWRNAAEGNTKKIMRLIEKMKSMKHGHDLTYSKEDECWLAKKSETGEWINHSDLLMYSHLKAKGYGSFEETITTLEEREKIQKRTGRMYKTTKNSDGKSVKISLDKQYYRVYEK